MSEQQAIEVVIFKGVDGVTPEQMRAAAHKVAPRLQALAGFVSRSFGIGADGRYVDIVHWQDMASAQGAAKEVMDCPQCREFFALIAPESVQMMHFQAG
ncbi:hypothetical protein [Roseateles oligotrophus]|uniref:Antibiotic biosynthesis monooxygenase n=1 Tax=Roseateles oligotrophus TaxID=1769250 RepID=A0ABT2Y8B9_9BURK|nr:hypothetical protein [Roseateles oligotrophus]MCV2366541.1 hypothetical protein [Roseateles oligotrophus]